MYGNGSARPLARLSDDITGVLPLSCVQLSCTIQLSQLDRYTLSKVDVQGTKASCPFVLNHSIIKDAIASQL